MPFNCELEPGDMLIVPNDSGAKIRVAEKTGRRTRLSVESAKPVEVIKAKTPAESVAVPRPAPSRSGEFKRPM